MRLTARVVAAVLAAASAACGGTSATRDTIAVARQQGAADSTAIVSAWVNEFYTWYLRPDSTGAIGLRSVESERPSVIDDTLRRALDHDGEMQKVVEGEAAIDADIYTGSQDPCSRYFAGSPVTRKGDLFVVPIRHDCGGARPPDDSDPYFAYVRARNGRLAFVNFVRGGQYGYDLIERIWAYDPKADMPPPVSDSSAQE